MDNDYSEGKAIPFITYNSSTQKFEFNRESEKIIRDINGEFSVISIVGAYRSGKSYLLNKMLLNYSKGFSVGKTVNACTKGIWIWSKPLIGVSPEGKTIPVLLLDTEGFGSHDSDFGHDSKIFTLAVLLSSLFMYNSVGVIDENVLDSLGFICNLGKLIGSKTMNLDLTHYNQNQNNSQEQAQTEALFEDIFPSLLWVLRDFTLQLLDDDGSNLTATDYLEKVLNFIPRGKSSSASLPSGEASSDPAAKSNKKSIRDTIKTYFKFRECMIMVRPVNSEKDLQNLDELSDEKIRPDFLQQVLSLRKKLFNNCKPKTFNGIKLNSESYLNIITEYIEVMNSGKLPTIDSIWNNICKYESQKALDEAENIYEEFLRENLNKKCVDDNEIEKLHEQAKQISLDVFRRKSLGDISNTIRKTLKRKIDEKLIAFSKQNEEENKNEIFNFMKSHFNKIEMKLKKSEINSLDDLQNEILQVENKCVDAFPNTRIRAEMILDFKYNVILFASNYIVSKLLDEKQFLCEKIEQEKNQNCESKEKLSSDLFKMLDENKELKINLNYAKEELLLNKEKCLIYEKDKEQIIAGYEEKIKSAKDENLKLICELNEKYAAKEKQFLETEKRLFEAREKYEKEKAELDVKIEFLTKSLNELASKEKEKNLEAEMNLKEQIVLNKNALTNFENRIKELQAQNESLTDKINELENKIFEKDNLLEIEKNKYEDTLRKTSLEKHDLTEKLKTIKFQLENNEAKFKEEIQLKESEITSLKNNLRLKDEENLAETKLLEENLKSSLLKAEKELSLQLQNNQFLEFKCTELSSQLAESKTNYENAISAFEKKMLSQNENFINGKNQEMENYYLMEKKQLEDNFALEKNMLQKEIQSLTNKNQKQEEINKAIIEELEKTNKEYKENLDKVKQEITSLQNLIQKLEEEKSMLQEENSLKYKKFMEDFEKKMEEKDAFYRRDIEIINKSCEDTIANYKAMFENEKNRLEEKIRDEKQKYDKKLKYTQDEYEIKLRDVEKEMKSEIENLKMDYEELEETHKNYILDAENEIRILNQKINNLENSLKENKDYLATFQSQYNSNLDKRTESFNNEKKDLLKRLEGLTAENNQKDQELTGLKFKAEQMEKQISEFNQVLKKEKDASDEIKNDLTEKYENMKKKYQEISDEFVLKKLESTRESGLLKQQIEFVNKKLEEMTKNNEENNHCIESIIFNTKREVEAEYSSKIESIRKEKEELAAKLTNKKREHRELEQAFLKQTCIYDKEKQQLNEKVSSLESKMKEICEHYKAELDRISLDMNGLREESDLKASEFKSQIDALRDKNTELERENKMMLTKKSDLKTKIELLENQIEESKISMIEMQGKCESFLKSALTKAQAEKEQGEKEYQEKLTFLEQTYFSALQKMEGENKRLIELTRDHKEIEDELINLSRQASSSLRMNDPVLISKKIQELLNVQDNLRKELEETRLEKDKKIAELISKHEREKEIYNIKLIDYEVKMKSYANYNGNNANNNHGNSAPAGFDRKKSNEINYFDIEKEKVKWKAEKEKLLGTINNLNSQIQKIEKKSDNLFKENEQLRNSQNNFPFLGEMNKSPAANFTNLNSNKNFATSSNSNNNNINHNFFSNNDDGRLSPNKFSKTSRNNVSTLNDKEIPVDNLKRNNHLNLNMNLMNSPLGENRKSTVNHNNNNFNNAYANDENTATREHQIHKDINSVNFMQDKMNRRESFIHKINMNVPGGNNNSTSKFSPFKIKK